MSTSQNAFDYSIRIAELVKYLRHSEKDFPLCGELLNCGVTVGLCFHRAEPGQLPDYHKIIEALKESDYLIEIAVYSGYLEEIQSRYIREEGRDLLRSIENEVYKS